MKAGIAGEPFPGAPLNLHARGNTTQDYFDFYIVQIYADKKTPVKHAMYRLGVDKPIDAKRDGYKMYGKGFYVKSYPRWSYSVSMDYFGVADYGNVHAASRAAEQYASKLKNDVGDLVGVHVHYHMSS